VTDNGGKTKGEKRRYGESTFLVVYVMKREGRVLIFE
jgi:hypothetical protein